METLKESRNDILPHASDMQVLRCRHSAKLEIYPTGQRRRMEWSLCRIQHCQQARHAGDPSNRDKKRVVSEVRIR